MTTTDLISPLKKELALNVQAVKKPQMEAYMKNLFPYLGVPSPQRKEASRNFLNTCKQYPELWREVVKALWSLPEREYQYVAIDLAKRMKKFWTIDDIDLFKWMIEEKSWWDTVDIIATNLVGPLVQQHPSLVKLMDDWNDEPELWLNRCSLLFQLKYRNETDFKRLTHYIQTHRRSSEFFHQKAIGWALREYAKYQPQTVKKYVDQTELAPLSRREALKHFS